MDNIVKKAKYVGSRNVEKWKSLFVEHIFMIILSSEQNATQSQHMKQTIWYGT